MNVLEGGVTVMLALTVPGYVQQRVDQPEISLLNNQYSEKTFAIEIKT